MGLIKTSGIVTKTTKYGETSLIVTLITEDFGKISAIANNVRTKKSRMIAGLQLFAYSEIVMYKAKSKNGLYHLDEINLVESFQSLRTDLQKMAYASYFAEAANTAMPEDAPDNGILRLFLNTLYMLDKGLCFYEKIKMVFEWRLALEAGYAPDLEKCEACHGDSWEYLSLLEGTVFCENCKSGQAGEAKLSPVMQKIISHILSAEPKKIFSFEANEKVIKYLSSLGENYLMIQLDCDFKTLDYLKKVTALGE